ncbi:acetyl-CoA carboxylase biotin carboxyl carrier protein subunit [uncultured Flavobacterium sp.]|uniref:acetyl-CoA carboxylase biotin carboxyl carrier protein subunit n=1 Tax=uncultured Flavobacterium sp. TaxID=165435 RepID=UPI0030CA4778
MCANYKISVNLQNTFYFKESDLLHLDDIHLSNQNFHVLKANKPYLAALVSSNLFSKKYTVKVNNSIFEVVIENELDQLINGMGIEKGKTKVINAIKAPMPGLILQIDVVVGQEVKENDSLLILEAMKMENSFLSPRDGIIKSILVEKGNAVEKGELLIEFE